MANTPNIVVHSNLDMGYHTDMQAENDTATQIIDRWVGALTLSIGEGCFSHTVQEMYEQVMDEGFNRGFDFGSVVGKTTAARKTRKIVRKTKRITTSKRKSKR